MRESESQTDRDGERKGRKEGRIKRDSWMLTMENTVELSRTLHWSIQKFVTICPFFPTRVKERSSLLGYLKYAFSSS